MVDSRGKIIKFNPINLKRIPMEVLIEVGTHITNEGVCDVDRDDFQHDREACVLRLRNRIVGRRRKRCPLHRDTGLVQQLFRLDLGTELPGGASGARGCHGGGDRSRRTPP